MYMHGFRKAELRPLAQPALLLLFSPGASIFLIFLSFLRDFNPFCCLPRPARAGLEHCFPGRFSIAISYVKGLVFLSNGLHFSRHDPFHAGPSSVQATLLCCLSCVCVPCIVQCLSKSRASSFPEDRCFYYAVFVLLLLLLLSRKQFVFGASHVLLYHSPTYRV